MDIRNARMKLRNAAIKGNMNTLEAMAKNGGLNRLNDGNQRRTGYGVIDGLLFTAAEHNKPDVATFALKHGANPNVKLSFGATPLHAAAAHGSTAVIKILLKASSRVMARDYEGKTPLHYATRGWINSSRHSGDPITLLIQSGANVNAKDESGKTALQNAVSNCEVSMVRKLLHYGADPNVKDASSYTPLHLAAMQWSSSAQMVKVLLKYGARINAKTDDGLTPLHLASQMGNLDAVRALLNNGASISIKSTSNKTALNLAKKENIKKLIESWPGERTLRRRAANKALNNLPYNMKKHILSKTGLFAINEYGRPRSSPRSSNRTSRNNR